MILRNLFFVLIGLFCGSTLLVAQKSDVTITRDVRMTDAHQAIPGTRLAWIPPDGFHLNPGGMDVYVDTLRKGSLLLMGADSPMSADMFRKTMEMNIENPEQTTISSVKLGKLKGFLLEASDTTNTTGYGRFILCVGDAVGTTMFVGTFPFSAPDDRETAFREALLTMVVKDKK